MPRHADHDERKRQVADAVAGLIADGGLAAVTVARTAAAAGMSVGLVQHYFPTKDDMLLYTFTQVRNRIERRATTDATAADAAGARIEHILLAALAELIPTDPARRAECGVAMAFAGRAVESPHLADTLRASNQHLRDLLTQSIRNGKECGEVLSSTPETEAAARLLAHLDGLVAHAYTDPDVLPPAVARAALAEHLSTLFPGECRRTTTRSGVTGESPYRGGVAGSTVEP